MQIRCFNVKVSTLWTHSSRISNASSELLPLLPAWPDSQYVALGVSADADGTEKGKALFLDSSVPRRFLRQAAVCVGRVLWLKGSLHWRSLVCFRLHAESTERQIPTRCGRNVWFPVHVGDLCVHLWFLWVFVCACLKPLKSEWHWHTDCYCHFSQEHTISARTEWRLLEEKTHPATPTWFKATRTPTTNQKTGGRTEEP